MNYLSKCQRMILLVAFLLVGFTPAFAQNDAAPQSNVYKVQAQAISGSEILIRDRIVPLWGVKEVTEAGTLFNLNAQMALDALIGGGELECELINVANAGLHGQCINANRVDLAHDMLQKGFVVLNRAHVQASVFEEPYSRAQDQARRGAQGIWAGEKDETRNESVAQAGLVISGLILLVLIGSAAALIRIIQQGFAKVIDAQMQTLENFDKEQVLRDKEKQVIASMLRSEIDENRSKIEAHLTIYQELLKDLQDPDKPAKYQTSGDIIQKQPALERSVFDGNANKMELFERRFASEMVHFYARVKTTPEYLNVDSETPREEVIAIIKEVVESADKLYQRAELLGHEFVKYGFGGQVRTTS